MRKKYINRSLIVSLVAIGATIILLATIRSIYSGVAGAQTPTATEAAKNSQLARRVKGEVYYDVSFSTGQVSRGKEKRFNITVTAINSQTGKVDKNPFQRVQIIALPVEVSKTESGNDLWTPPGTFTPNIVSGKPSVYAEHSGGYSEAMPPGELWPVSNFDLIDGTATVSFSATNTPKTDAYMGFMVTPASWAFSFQPYSNTRISEAYRFTLKGPRQPSGYKFLYKEWQVDNTMAEHIFTIATLPVDNAPHQSIMELGSWQPETKLPDYQPQNDVAQNIVVPPAANLTPPIYDNPTIARSRLSFWLWLIGSLIVLVAGGLWWLTRKNSSHKAK
ncbi:hypothetical protein JXA59_01730 [Patescibacteria group bacterium]|nr:hypothetical protein [Patescibacteria group bacterium]